MPNVEFLWSGAAVPAVLFSPFLPAPPVLGQFAYGFGVGSLLGIGLVFCGLALYLLRSMRPNLARDHDIFFAAVSLLCGGILFFQGWRLDPILQFGQFLMTGSAIFFAVESIRLRGIVTQQAKRNTPIVDDDRPVSNNYRTYDAELEEIEPYEARPSAPLRRIAGSRDGRRSERGDRSAGAGYDDFDARGPRGSNFDDRPRPSSRKRRRPDASRDLNLRYDAPPDRGYGDDDYGDRRGGRRTARPSRSTGEMKATLEGYDTYTPDTPDTPDSPDYPSDRPSSRPSSRPSAADSDSPYDSRGERPTARSSQDRPSDRRSSRSPWDTDRSDNYETPYRDPGATRPAATRPAATRPAATRPDAPTDDFAEFYRDDEDFEPPRSGSDADDANDREPEYGA